jgi:hypothetical protein
MHREAKLLVDRWQSVAAHVRELPLRVGTARAELLGLPLEIVAPAIELLCARAGARDPAAREALLTVVTALVDPELGARRAELRIVALSHGLGGLARLLPVVGPLHAEPDFTDDDASDAPVPLKNAAGKPLTLGERKALARRPNRANFDKLLADPHPDVVRLLLENPRLTEDDVLRMASKRPAFPAILVELARHAAWSSRPRVRLALVLNPRTPPELAILFASLLGRPELESVSLATNLPRAVLDAARAHLGRPAPEPLGPAEAGG